MIPLFVEAALLGLAGYALGLGVAWLAYVPGVVMPGDLQLIDVFRSDLIQRRIALAPAGAPIGMPFAVRKLWLLGRWSKRGRL